MALTCKPLYPDLIMAYLIIQMESTGTNMLFGDFKGQYLDNIIIYHNVEVICVIYDLEIKTTQHHRRTT